MNQDLALSKDPLASAAEEGTYDEITKKEGTDDKAADLYDTLTKKSAVDNTYASVIKAVRAAHCNIATGINTMLFLSFRRKVVLRMTAKLPTAAAPTTTTFPTWPLPPPARLRQTRSWQRMHTWKTSTRMRRYI